VTYKLAWPATFVTYSKGAGAIVNLEVFSFLAMSNCALSVQFINKFLLQMMTPPMFIAAVVLAWWLLKCCHGRKPGWRKLQRTRGEMSMQIIIAILQLMYPKICTRTFQMFRCVDLGENIGLILEADFSKKCFDGIHANFVPLALVSVVVYLVGVPLITFVIVWRHRKKLHKPEIESLYGDLYRQYEDSWAFWEVCLQLQKCMLTGAMVAIAPGSPVQLLVALLVGLAYLLLVLHAKPFKGQPEDRLAFLVSLCLTVSLVLGLTLIMDNTENPVFAKEIVGVTLILINVLPFVYLLFAGVKILRNGPNYAIMGQGAATVSGRGGKSLSVRRQGSPKRLATMRGHVEKAVVEEKIRYLQLTSNQGRQAQLAKTKEMKARASDRLKARLAKRTDGMTQNK